MAYIWDELLRVRLERATPGAPPALAYATLHSAELLATNFGPDVLLAAVTRTAQKVLPRCLWEEYHDYAFPAFADPVGAAGAGQGAGVPPSPPPGPLLDRTKLTLLYLVLHQRMANLRQCPHLLYTLVDRVLSAVRGAGGGEPALQAQLQRACRLLNRHSRQVNPSSPHFADVNYADIDELYQTIVLQRFPRTTPAPTFTVAGLCPLRWPLSESLWVTSRRRVPQAELRQDAAGELHPSPPLTKTFPERVNWLLPLRLFLFNWHVHALVFLVCVAHALLVPAAALLWLVVTLECSVCILTLLLDLWITRFNYTLAVLGWLELGACVATLRLVGLYPQDLAHYQTTAMLVQCLAFLGCRLLAVGLRNAAAGRRRLNWGRAAFFLGMGATSLVTVRFLAVQVVGFTPLSLCRCQTRFFSQVETFIGCDFVAMYCYLGIVLLLVCTFISTLLVTHLLFVLESILYSFFSGIRDSVGTVKDWLVLRQLLAQLLAKALGALTISHQCLQSCCTEDQAQAQGQQELQQREARLPPSWLHSDPIASAPSELHPTAGSSPNSAGLCGHLR